MNAIERRALYHLLRMSWLDEQNLSVKPWQVEDYRSLPLAQLFERLHEFDISLERTSFIAFADECESPEDLTDHLTADRSLQAEDEDKIYLIVFELWRRLLSEKPSLSVLCNELDTQIYLYDTQQLENPFDLQNALSHFVQMLAKNVDEGVAADEAFELISPYCANDIEAFLYDFIAEQIDADNELYASELLDDFEPYLSWNKWFKLLRMRLHGKAHKKIGQKIAILIIEEHLEEQDLDFNLEFLTAISEIEDPSLFNLVIKVSLPLMECEEDFQELLSVVADDCHRTDPQQEELLLSILERRKSRSPNHPLDEKDPDLAILINLLNFR